MVQLQQLSWSQIADMSTARSGVACCGGAASGGNPKVYAAGGVEAPAAFEAYDTVADSWASLAAVPTGRSNAGAAFLNGIVYLIGGVSAGAVTGVVEAYDVTGAAWSSKTAMPTPRHSFAIGVYNGAIYVAGGVDAAVPSSVVEAYDPSTDTWATLAQMPEAGACSGDIETKDENFPSLAIVMQGSGNAWAFYPDYNEWGQAEGGSAALARAPARTGLAVVAAPNVIYAISGFDTVAEPYVDQLSHLVTPAQWLSEASLSQARYNHGAVNLDGAIYVVGGLDASGIASASVFASSLDRPPYPPVLLSPVMGDVVDLTLTQRFKWLFGDPDAGDAQSQYRFDFRVVGGTWTIGTVATSSDQFHDAAPSTFAAGDYEWRVTVWDAGGTNSTTSASGFFTAKSPPATPSWTSPPAGSTLSSATTDFTFSTSDTITASQWRVVADNAGAPDDSTVYSSGSTLGAALRTFAVFVPVTGVTVHVQSAVKAAGLWSAWGDSSHPVNYTPPSAPTATITAGSDGFTVSLTNPTGATAADHNDIYRRLLADGGAGIRVATGVAVGGSFPDGSPASGETYQYKARAVAADGSFADSGWVP